MRDTNVWDDDLDVIANKTFMKIVTIVKSFKKTPPRPALALPLPNEFDEAAHTDLKYRKNNLYILYMIDMFSRFILWCFITKNMIRGKFANPTFRGLYENLNVHFRNTADESLW